MNPTDDLTCRDLIEFLADYVAGDVSVAQRTEFDRHLAICPSCRAYLSTYRQTIALSGASNDEEAASGMPEALKRAILAAIRT